MIDGLSRYIDAFAQARVLVLGEAMLDCYVEGHCSRVCPEAPAPVVACRRRHRALGGAANTAANLAMLGADVRLVTAMGRDATGAALQRELKRRGIATDFLIECDGRRTLRKERIVSDGQIVMRLDRGDGGAVGPAIEAALIDRLNDQFPVCDAVVVSDYGYGIWNAPLVAELAKWQARSPRIVVIDSKRLPAYQSVRPTAVKPNYVEALSLLNLEERAGAARVDQMFRHGRRILHQTRARIAAVTLDGDGAVIFERDNAPYRTYARRRPNSRAAGAGDTFISTLALAMAAGAETPAAAELAAAAASVSAEPYATTCCSTRELRAVVSGSEKSAADLPSLVRAIASYRRAGLRIVFTNGCFDILHRGHVTYLSGAKALGDVLIIGVNSDESVRRVKGPHRPINPLPDRLQVLSALSCVDHLIPFDDDTPAALIRALRPDVFVKGGDYTRERLPEAAIVDSLGGEVVILPLISDRSTSNVIERIRTVYGLRRSALDGVPSLACSEGHPL